MKRNKNLAKWALHRRRAKVLDDLVQAKSDLALLQIPPSELEKNQIRLNLDGTTRVAEDIRIRAFIEQAEAWLEKNPL